MGHVRSLPRLLQRLRHGGPRWLLEVMRERLHPARPRFHDAAAAALLAGRALEIGGPSRLFRHRGGLPAYAWLDRIDNVNFSGATAWETDLRDEGAFRFHPAKPPGRQFLREASALTRIANAGYDAILSSHCLEHLADPLSALKEWRRVARPGGHLLLALPDPSRTFDHRRPVTSLEHLLADQENAIDEGDLTHLDEILALHDLRLDPAAGTRPEFEKRCRENIRHRCLHHHVFDLALIKASLAEAGWEVLGAEKLAPLHLVAWARKPEVSAP
jgi:hypothetical protein